MGTEWFCLAKEFGTTVKACLPSSYVIKSITYKAVTVLLVFRSIFTTVPNLTITTGVGAGG